MFHSRQSTPLLFLRTFSLTRAYWQWEQQMLTQVQVPRSNIPCLALVWRISTWMQTLVNLYYLVERTKEGFNTLLLTFISIPRWASYSHCHGPRSDTELQTHCPGNRWRRVVLPLWHFPEGVGCEWQCPVLFLHSLHDERVRERCSQGFAHAATSQRPRWRWAVVLLKLSSDKQCMFLQNLLWGATDICFASIH